MLPEMPVAWLRCMSPLLADMQTGRLMSGFAQSGRRYP
jgi:hypothetical protein